MSHCPILFGTNWKMNKRALEATEYIHELLKLLGRGDGLESL
jgi:triosephosphate isomerase